MGGILLKNGRRGGGAGQVREGGEAGLALQLNVATACRPGASTLWQEPRAERLLLSGALCLLLARA